MADFWNWWQHLPEHIDPVIFQIGGFRLQYYGLMYLVAFTIAYFAALYRLKTEERWQVSAEQLQGLITTIIVGLILGARLGYVLIYNFPYYAAHPLEIFLPFQFRGGFHFTGISGMSYHGGLAGGLLAMLYYSRKYKIGALEAIDLLTPGAAAGYTFGRLGNFLNGELWGRVTTAPIGMYFPEAGDHFLRHPSQLYEALGEGILLSLVLWSLRRRVKTPGAMFCLYLIGYGTARFVIEYFREPDRQLGFVLFSFSMGQILSALMIVGGTVCYFLLRERVRHQQ